MMKVERKEGTVVDGKGKAHGVYSFRSRLPGLLNNKSGCVEEM